MRAGPRLDARGPSTSMTRDLLEPLRRFNALRRAEMVSSVSRNLRNQRSCGGARISADWPFELKRGLARLARYLVGAPRWRTAARGHGLGLPRTWTRRRINSAASTPDIILPISSGGIVACISAESLRPSPNGTPGASRRATAVRRARNIDVASIMTAPTGGRLASPKVSKKSLLSG